MALTTAVVLLWGCGESGRRHATEPSARTVASSPSAARVHLGELLSVPAVGRIYGRCDPHDKRWTIEFSNGSPVTDSVTYRTGSDRTQTALVDPSRSVVWKLAPSQYTSHEPADVVSHFPATTIKTTAPLSVRISQGSEPHIYRVDIRFAVTAAIGDTTECALIASELTAMTYHPGGQPPG